MPALLVLLAGCAASDTSTTTTKPAAPASDANSAQPAAARRGANRDAPVANAGPGVEGAPVLKDVPGLMGPGKYTVINGERAAIPAVPMGDASSVAKIIAEGKNNNHVMDHITYLSTQIGPRLTGSSNADRACHWAEAQFKAWGLKNVHLYEWGQESVRFDRGPSTARIVDERETRDGKKELRTLRDLEFTTLAWTGGTNGPVKGPIVKMPSSVAEFEEVSEKIPGAWILVKSAPPGRMGVRGAAGNMNSRQQLFMKLRHPALAAAEEKPAEAPVPNGPAPAGAWEGVAKGGPMGEEGAPIKASFTLGEEKNGVRAVTGTFGFSDRRDNEIKNGTFNPGTGELVFSWEMQDRVSTANLKLDGEKIKGDLTREGGPAIALSFNRPEPKKPEAMTMEERVWRMHPAGFISSSPDDRVRTGGLRSWRELKGDALPQDAEVQVRNSDYDYINSRLADGFPLMAEFDLKNTLTPGPFPMYDVIAEIPGTEKPDEVVIISAHLDSWNGPGSQGTTDNGTGSSVTLEAARILATTGVKPKRTIRFILWTGEEQGLLGSAAYVKSLSPEEQAKISAVFVDDGGTNTEGGLGCLESMKDYLAAATAPVNGQFWSDTDHRFLDVNIHTMEKFSQEAGSDHASFNRVGIPGFFWDEIGRADYFFGWHTQNDKLNLAIPEYLVQSSTCAAITSYNLACAPNLLARVPQEKKKDTAPKSEPTKAEPSKAEPAKPATDASHAATTSAATPAGH
jgi:hypothetical protein